MQVSRAELIERLKKLAESGPPKDLNPGAFCYSMGPREIKKTPCPECQRTMIEGWKEEILREYNVPLKRIQDQGIDVTLIAPEHCPCCGFALKKKKFILEIKYPDHSAPIRVKLVDVSDLELMVLFLQGKDRYEAGFGHEKTLKSKISRLATLFGIKKQKGIASCFSRFFG